MIRRGLRSLPRKVRQGHGLKWWVRRGLIIGVLGPIQRQLADEVTPVMERRWDNLVVLDACRADLFEETVDLDQFDSYERTRSKGSATYEWCRRNFQGEYGDTVYVNSNPNLYDFRSSFHEMYHVWETDFSDREGTVLPTAVTEAAREAADRHPDKRLIVHYMQPHHPFLDEDWGNEFFHNPEEETPWQLLEKGRVTREEVWTAYAHNLTVVMESVSALLEELPGESVVTSDHGNMLGERIGRSPIRGYGHHIGLRTNELVQVPWAVRRAGTKQITSGRTRSSDIEEDVEEKLDDRLRALGYR